MKTNPLSHVWHPWKGKTTLDGTPEREERYHGFPSRQTLRAALRQRFRVWGQPQKEYRKLMHLIVVWNDDHTRYLVVKAAPGEII